jgi:hypothetical protein
VHDLAEPDELDELDQAAVRAVELQPVPTPGSHDLQPGQGIHGGEVGRHQPRDVESDDAATGRATVVSALVCVVHHQTKLRGREKLVAAPKR